MGVYFLSSGSLCARVHLPEVRLTSNNVTKTSLRHLWSANKGQQLNYKTAQSSLPNQRSLQCMFMRSLLTVRQPARHCHVAPATAHCICINKIKQFSKPPKSVFTNMNLNYARCCTCTDNSKCPDNYTTLTRKLSWQCACAWSGTAAATTNRESWAQMHNMFLILAI